MIVLYYLNRKLKEFLESSRSIEHKKSLIQEVLETDLVSRINPILYTSIKDLFENEIEIMTELHFKPLIGEVGKTYGLFVEETRSEGLCLILKVSCNSNPINSGIRFIGSASSFEENFRSCFEYVSRIIQSNLSDAYFLKEVQNNFEIKLLNAFNDPVKDLMISGNSIELPLCVAIFSALVGLNIDPSIACTGNVDENLNVTYVDGLEEKISAALLEFPEIKKFVVPEDCRSRNLEDKFRDVEIIYVKNLEESLELFFDDYRKILNERNFNGKINIISREVKLENGHDALEIEFDLKTNQTLQTESIQVIFNIVSRIVDEWSKKGYEIFLLYNFRMNWLIASLMSIFNNKSKAVGVYYTETNSYIIVYKSRTEDTFKLGQSIGKKITSEDFKSS